MDQIIILGLLITAGYLTGFIYGIDAAKKKTRSRIYALEATERELRIMTGNLSEISQAQAREILELKNKKPYHV